MAKADDRVVVTREHWKNVLPAFQRPKTCAVESHQSDPPFRFVTDQRSQCGRESVDVLEMGGELARRLDPIEAILPGGASRIVECVGEPEILADRVIRDGTTRNVWREIIRIRKIAERQGPEVDGVRWAFARLLPRNQPGVGKSASWFRELRCRNCARGAGESGEACQGSSCGERGQEA